MPRSAALAFAALLPLAACDGPGASPCGSPGFAAIVREVEGGAYLDGAEGIRRVGPPERVSVISRGVRWEYSRDTLGIGCRAGVDFDLRGRASAAHAFSDPF